MDKAARNHKNALGMLVIRGGKMHGKRVRKGLMSSILACLLVLSMVLTAFADNPTIDLTSTGSIEITMTTTEDGKEVPLPGGEMAIYQVATVVPVGGTVETPEGGYSYKVTDDFMDSGIQEIFDGLDLEDPKIDWAGMAETLEEYVITNNITPLDKDGTIGSDGTVTYNDLELGLYLLVQIEPAPGYYAANPFLVSVPFYNGDSYDYSVDASPKTEAVGDSTQSKEVDTDNDGQYDNDGALVSVDQILTYEISYTNTHAIPVDILIVDELDPNVEYQEGSADPGEEDVFTFTPDDSGETGGILRWTLTDVPGRESGTVTFKVKVLDTAPVAQEVNNQARVTVHNDDEIYTNWVRNPITEKDVDVDITDSKDYDDNGVLVAVGQTLTYKVTYENGHEEPADIVITDTLDSHVEYVPGSASDNGSYNADTHTITWNLPNVAAGYRGNVTFQVIVLPSAQEPGEVDNTASVKVNGDASVDTNTVYNPVTGKGVDTDGDTFFDNDGASVTVGTNVVYEITYKTPADAESTKVTIEDVLDDGLTFVSADNDGVYDSSTRTITWVIENVPADTQGSVSFTARINTTGRLQTKVDNDADLILDYGGGHITRITTNKVENPVPGGGSSRSGGGGGGGSGSGGGGGSGSGGPGGSSGDGDSGGSSWDLLPLPQTGQGWAMLIAVCAMIVAGVGLIVAYMVRRKN